jgi:hypothetical protein
MLDLRTEKAKKESKVSYDKWSKELRESEKRRINLAKKIWGKLPWQPITNCPFEDYKYKKIFVTDGKTVSLGKVNQRFGTPIRCIKEPVMAMTDNGMQLVGGKYAKIKAPEWWFKWEIENVEGMETYAGGHETGKEEVAFIATHWLPLPPQGEIPKEQ